MTPTSRKISRAIFIGFILLYTVGFGIGLIKAWDRESIIAPVTEAPVIDGIKDQCWDSANTTLQTSESNKTRMQLYTLINNSYLYILLEVKINKEEHNNYEFLGLLISNSSAANATDFVDAKVIRNYNFTTENSTFIISDEHLMGNEYVNDSSVDFEGAAAIYGDAGYSYYEFKLPFGTVDSDYANDSMIYPSEKYAFKVMFGYNDTELGNYYIEYSDPIIIQIGLSGEETDQIGEFKIDWDALTMFMFITVFICFAGIAVYTITGKKRVR